MYTNGAAGFDPSGTVAERSAHGVQRGFADVCRELFDERVDRAADFEIESGLCHSVFVGVREHP